jgi:hypothetical protein
MLIREVCLCLPPGKAATNAEIILYSGYIVNGFSQTKTPRNGYVSRGFYLVGGHATDIVCTLIMPLFEQVKMVRDTDVRITSLLHNVTTNGTRKLMGDKLSI